MQPHQIQLRSSLTYEVRQPTVFLLKIGAKQTAGQHILQESFTLDPAIPLDLARVGMEGDRLHRVSVQPCEFHIEYSATVELSPEVRRAEDVGEVDIVEMPPDVLTYLNPSRYCESDLLARFAFEEFGELPAGYQRVEAITNWVYNHLEYTPGSTTGTTTASDVLLSRQGVCRDYAHLAVTLCRGVGVPARYVSVYAVDLHPPDFHGVFEAYLDGQWYWFDATRLAPVEGFVRIGAGRDAADVAFSTVMGDAVLKDKQVLAEQVRGPSLDPPGTQDAVSLA